MRISDKYIISPTYGQTTGKMKSWKTAVKIEDTKKSDMRDVRALNRRMAMIGSDDT